ncbi:MAG: Ig-like domain-containing protein, partial [Bacteroidales bacterium]|nr:Ig-like domain-containing protein [Bacteroidales bacterium]
MRRFLLSFVMVFTVAFAMAQNSGEPVINGGTVDFSNDTVFVIACSGESFTVYVENSGGDEYYFSPTEDSPSGAPQLHCTTSGASVMISSTGVSVDKTTTYKYTIRDDRNVQINVVLCLLVAQTAATPQITTSAESFSVGTEYLFTATSTDSNPNFEWSVTLENDGCTFIGDNTSETAKISFSKSGSYILKCAASYEMIGCKSESATMEITVPEPTITYTAPTISVCIGSDSTYTISATGDITETLTMLLSDANDGISQQQFGGIANGSFYTFDLSGLTLAPGLYNAYVYGDKGQQLATAEVTLKTSPETPVISVSGADDGYMAGKTYVFSVNNENCKFYSWNVTPVNLPTGYGFDYIEGWNDQIVTIKFYTAEEYVIKALVTNDDICSNATEMSITVGEFVANNSIIANDTVICMNAAEKKYIMKSMGEPFTGTYNLKTGWGTIEGTNNGYEVEFDLSSLREGGFNNAEIADLSTNETVARVSFLLTSASPYVGITHSGNDMVGQSLEFTNVHYPNNESYGHYTWSIITGGDDYTIDNEEEGAFSVTFNEAGTYIVKCEAYYGSPACSNQGTYTVTVSEPPVCSISGTPYSTLGEALSSIQEGETVVLNSDCSEEGAYANTSFSLDLNGHEATLQSLIVDEALTVTNGTLTAALWGHGASGTLTVDGATINTVPNPTDYMDGHKTFKWKGDIELANNGVLEVQDSAYFGGDEGFTLSIDNTSSMNLNNAIIVIPDMDADTATTLNQIRQYLPDGYTVNASENYNWDADGYVLEFSPDANVTLSFQQPITYTAEPVTTCFNQWDEGEFAVTASDVVEGSYVMTFGEYELTTQRTDGDQIYFELKNIPAGTYNVTVWNSDKSKQLCTSTLTILDASLNVEGPEEGVTNEPLTFTVTNPVSGVTYNWVVEMYGGDSNSPADPSSYTAASFEGTTFTVTFLEADEYYRISCNSSCGYGTEMALSIYEKVIELPKSQYVTNLWQTSSTVAAGFVQESLEEAEVQSYIPQIGDTFSYTLKGVADYTGTVGFYLADQSESACWWAPFTDSTQTYYTEHTYQVTEGEPFEIEGTLVISHLSWDNWRNCGDGGKAVTLTTPTLDIEAHSADGELDADKLTLSLTEYSLTFTETEIVRTYYVFGKAVACNGETTTVQIAAPQGFANAANLSITNADKLTFESSVVDTLLTVELPAGTYYLYDNGEDPVLEFSVTEETITDLEISGSETVEIVGELGQNGMGWTYYVPFIEGNTYEWTCSGDVSVTSERMGSSHWATVRFTTPGSYVLSCTETNTNGCSHTVTKDVTVKQYTYTIPQDNVVLCSGDGASVTVIITCNTVEGFNGQFAVAKDYTTDKLASYTIEEGDGMAKAHVTITEPGTYNLYYGGNEVDDVYYRNQINSLSFTVTEETITATITGPTMATVDEEVTYSVTASSTLPNATLTYSWGGGVENSLESDLMAVGSFSTSDIGEAEVFCLVESENGCSYEAKLAVTVEEPVETEFTISEKSTLTVCQGESATVVITAEPAASFIVVSADNETIYTADNEDYVTLTPTMTTAGDYTYYIVEDGTQKKSFTITVNEKPTVTITALQSVVCVGDEVQLEASMNLSDGSFFWGGADNFDDATSGNPKFVATYAGHYPIFCQVTGAGNCSGTAELSLQVYPTPTVTIEGSSEVTAGEDVTYTASVTYEGESTFVYNWTGVAQGSDQTLTTTFTDEGLSNLYCEVMTREGCKGADTLEVTVSEPPFVCDNDEITLAYSGETSTSGMYGYTYLYENVVTTAAEGDTFVMEWKGTSNFTGEMNICLIDRSEEAGYWSEISNWESIYVEKDVPFSVIKTFTINGTLSSEPEFGLAATVVLEKQRESVTLCQTDFSIKKEEIVKVFEMYYNEYGENWQRHYPETQTEVLQAVYEATGESEYVPVMEDVFMLSITGKANYTGSLDFYIVDERQEVGYWQELTSSKGTFVSEGEYFSVQVPLTVTQTLYNKIRLNQAGLQINAKPIYVNSNLGTTDTATITLSEYSFTFIPSGGQLEVLKTITLNYDEYASDEDGDGISDSWRRDGNTNTNEFGDLIREKTGLYSYYMASLFGHDEYYTPKVGDKLTYSMKGTADFTGRMSCALIDESAEVCYYAEFSSYNETYVNEGEPFVFEGELVITNVESICEDNPARMMNPEFHISIFPSVTSTNAEFDNTKEYTLSLTDYTLDFIVDDYECDGTRLMFGSAESVSSLQKSIADEITEETTFNLSWTGTPNFTGIVQATVIDASEEVSGYMALSHPIEIEVEANKAFTVNQDVVVSTSTSAKPNYVIEIFVPHQSEGFKATAPTVDICETEFSFVKVEQQPVSVSFSQSSYEISAGGSELICLVTEGIDLSKATITYNVSSNLSVKDKNEGCVIVTDQNGVASTQQIEAVVIYNNKEYTATADIQIIEEQPNCEGTFVTFTSAEETYGGTTYYFYESSHDVEIYNASEDDTFEFEWSFTPNFLANSVSVALVDLSNNNSSSATTYFTEGSNRTQVFNFSLPEGNNEKSTYAIKTIIQSNEKIKNATLCESYFSFKKVEKPLYAKEFITEYNYYGTDTDGDGVSDGWQSGFDEFPAAVEKSTGNVAWTPAIGDVFSLSMQGVSNFTGTVNLFMVDQRENAGYWGVASEHVPGFYVVEGEPFNITDYFAVTSTGNDDVTYEPNFVVLCQPEVTSTSAGFSEFITYKLSLTNYGLSFYPSTATGTCDGNLITTLNSGVVDITNYVDNAIETGDKVTVNWSATPDFTGELSVSLVDGRNTAEDAWLFMADPITFEVTKDVAFEVSMPFDVTDTHIKPFYQMYVAVNDKEGSADVYNICSSEISVTIKKEEDIPVECDGNLIKITGQYGDNYHVDGVPTVGDVYDVELTITPNFSGELWLNVTDKSFMNSISKQQKISLVEGVTTETTISFEIIENSSADYSEGFELTKLIRPNSTEGTFYLCESNFSIKKHKELPNYVKVIEVPYDEWGEDYDGDNVSDNWREGISAYESLGVDTYAPVLGDHVEYHMKGIADFTGTISLGLIDEREEACYYAELSDYNSYDVVEGEEFEINGTLVVSNIQSICDDKAVELMNPMLNVACLPNVMSTNADFSTEKKYSLSFTDYSLVYEQKQEADCMLTITMENSNSVALARVYENIAVGDEYYAHVTGVADFTGDVFFAFVDNSEEANWWYMLDNETKGLSVVEGDTLNFKGYFTVTNPVITSKPEIAFMVGLVDSEGLGKVANICVSSVEFVKQENTFTCEGDKLILNGAEGGALATFDEVSLGDVYTCHVEGVTDFTDEVYVALVDHSEEAGWWSEMAEPLAFNVVAGEPFVYEGTFTVTEQTKSTAPEYVIYIGHSKAEGGPISRFCITKSQIEKRDVVFTLSETEVSMIVGDKKQLAVVVSESEYPFEVAWNSTNPDVVSVENGLVSALADGTAEVQVLVNNKVVASASVIVNCENYWVRFDNKNYEITEGDSISACLSFGECFNHVDPQFEFNPNVISLTEPSDKQSTCGTITGLMAGQTSVIVSAYANGMTYTDTAIVVVKMKANKETLISLIDEGHGIQEKVLEGTYVISPIVYNEFQETMQNANEIRDNNKATQDEVDAVANSLYVAIDAIKLIAAHQMPDPVLTTEEITVCHNRTGDAISLAEFAQTTTVNGKLQWFDESGNILESTPEIDFKTIGKLTYYVTQIGTGATAECLPSDTLPLTINIVYVAAPEMNVYEQKLCNGEELQPFVAKTTNNVVWFNADSVKVAEGNSFTPSATGTYYAYTKESVDGCVSEATIVTYMLGRKAIPTVVMKDSKTEFAVGEPIEMTAQNIDADVFSIVWTVDGITMQGEEFSISTLSEGAHTIICREIDMASGCYDSTMVEIEVKNLVVPVTSISVEPGDMELYTNEKGHFAVSFEPAHATNQRYVVTVADTGVAVVSGATVIPVGAGETTLTVSSAENGEISASVSVKVTEY